MTRATRTARPARATSAGGTGGTGTDPVAALHEQITAGVAALTESDAWRAMLTTAARFHTYSLGNLLLILAQRPDATRVAGFGTWKTLGRSVRKGEHGIAILAPCTYRLTTTSATDPTPAGTDTAPSGTDPKAGTGSGTAAGRQLRGFRRVHVFDVSQTDGEPLPDVRAQLITGQAPAGLWDALAAQVQAHDYVVERGKCGSANGWTDPATRTVRVRADIDDAHAVKTLAHELGHIEAGHTTDGLFTYQTCRGRCEVEAESIAYVVTGSQGLDASGYSFGYVARWAGGDATTVRATATTVLTAARTIIDRLTPPDQQTHQEHQDQQPAAADQPSSPAEVAA